jgi:hypothetical protein
MRNRFALFWLCIAAYSASLGLLMAKDREPQLKFEELQALLGKDHLSNELCQFRKSMKVEPEVSYSNLGFGVAFYHTWKDKGLQLCFNNKNKLIGIHLFAANQDGFEEYKGTLPGKLQFEHSRKLVEKTLGKPDEAGGGGVINYWVYYKKYNIIITYRSKDENNLETRIAHVTMIQPDKEEE